MGRRLPHQEPEEYRDSSVRLLLEVPEDEDDEDMQWDITVCGDRFLVFGGEDEDVGLCLGEGLIVGARWQDCWSRSGLPRRLTK